MKPSTLSTPSERQTLRMRRIEAALIVGITALAALLRFTAIGSLPPGLYHDEAYNGLDALRILAGERPLFFEANNGREPLFIYLVALSVRLFGRTPGALRLVSATVGTLTVPAAYGLARALWRERRLAALTALLTACSVWMMSLSRVAFRAGALPLCSALMLALLWRAWQARRLLTMVGAGGVCGLCLYTYLAARFVPLALVLFFLYLLWRERRQFWWSGWIAFATSALIVAAPLIVYFAQHWQSTLARAGQVSVWNPVIGGQHPWLTLIKQIARTAGALVWHGDFIPRHNVPLRPIFDPIMGVAFAVGLWMALKRAKQDAAWALSLIWLGVMFLPTILAEGAPHFVRASGVLPVLFLFPAAGLAVLWRWSVRYLKPLGASGLIAAMVAWSAVSCQLAMARHLHSEAVYYNFEAGATQLAQEINTALGRGWTGDLTVDRPFTPATPRQALIAHRLWQNWAGVRFLCPESDALTILDPFGNPPSEYAGSDDVTLFLWPFEDSARALAALPAQALISVREGSRERGDLETESRLLYVTIRGQARHLTDAPSSAAAPIARWQGGISLARYQLVAAPDGLLTLDLLWETDHRLSFSYTIFRHVLCDGHPVGQLDGFPAQGYYPTDYWRLGDLVEDIVVIPLSEPFDASRCQVQVGWYEWLSGARLDLIASRVLSEGGTAAILR